MNGVHFTHESKPLHYKLRINGQRKRLLPTHNESDEMII